MAGSRAERRLAAILAADVVGFSHLIEQDEASTLATLKDLRRKVIDPLLTEHRGRIVKLMGDGAIVEFGSVVDAVACADAIQRGVADHQKERPAEWRPSEGWSRRLRWQTVAALHSSVLSGPPPTLKATEIVLDAEPANWWLAIWLRRD
jgi:class 3 adenylate cyclase